MPVRSEGAPSVRSSDVSAYSNSKPTTRIPTPKAKPLAARVAGVVVLPMKTVTSAKAGDADREDESRPASSESSESHTE